MIVSLIFKDVFINVWMFVFCSFENCVIGDIGYIIKNFILLYKWRDLKFIYILFRDFV